MIVSIYWGASKSNRRVACWTKIRVHLRLHLSTFEGPSIHFAYSKFNWSRSSNEVKNPGYMQSTIKQSFQSTIHHAFIRWRSGLHKVGWTVRPTRLTFIISPFFNPFPMWMHVADAFKIRPTHSTGPRKQKDHHQKQTDQMILTVPKHKVASTWIFLKLGRKTGI